MAAASVTAPPLDGLRFVGTLIRFIRTVEQEARRMPGADDLSIADVGVLGQIDRGADCPSQVARSLRLDPARVTHVTDRLVALGYVARASDPNDRRRWRLSLTVAGTARLAQGRRDTLAAVERLLAGLSDDERTGMALGMDGIRRELDGVRGMGGRGDEEMRR